MTKSTGLRTVIKNIVDPIKSGINFVGREIIKPILTLGGTFDLDDTLSFAEFTAQVKGYDSMSQAQKDAVALQFADYSAQKGLNEASSNAFVSTTMSKKYSNAGIYRHWSQNHKEAISSLKTSLKSMKPGDIFSENSRGASTSLKRQFKNWVQSNYGNEGNYLLRQSQSHYEEMMKILNKISGKYWDKYSVYGGSKAKKTKV